VRAEHALHVEALMEKIERQERGFREKQVRGWPADGG
jgi:hypothetical protein